MKHPNDFYYRLDIQYLGFRYHGWQKQPNVKTVQLMLEKTINYILNDEIKFKVLAASRTDAMVSANHSVIQLIVNKELNESQFISLLNNNLPADIKALQLIKVTSRFNAINDVISKEYIYSFTFKDKPSPFSAPYIAFFHENLSVDKMFKAVNLFEGVHNFQAFTDHEKEKDFDRKISLCSLDKVINSSIPFYPSEYYKLTICSNGFMKYQIRYIMGALVALGRGDITSEMISNSLINGGENLSQKAPASGLVLNKIYLKEA